MEYRPFSAIIPAAGMGKRTGFNTPKQWIEMDGAPLVVHVLRIFEKMPEVTKVCLALNAEEFDDRRKQIGNCGLELDIVYCHGGKRRQDTVGNALAALAPADNDIVVIHDAARPFCSQDLIRRVVNAARKDGAALAAIPVVDTIKEIDRVGFVTNTPKRTFLRRAQTPQAVRAEVLKQGLELASEREIELTDDVLAAELMGRRVAVVNGEESNFKITTALDLEIARQQVERNAVSLKHEDVQQ